MGATFFFDADEQISETYKCNCTHDGEFPANENCSMCKGTGAWTHESGKHEFHFSYGSTYKLLDAIGYEYDQDTYAGTLLWQDMEDYMDRLMECIVAGFYEADRGMYVLKAMMQAWSKKSDMHFG